MKAMWTKKHKTPTATQKDVGEARSMRDDARADLQAVRKKDLYVAGLASRLVERRDLNGFGEQIQITYTRRNA